MKMQRRRFRIGDLAKRLYVDKFVIRFWEKEFDLCSNRSEGGQRFYEEKDFIKFQQIKELLYEKKFTIAGAKKQLLANKNIIASIKTNMSSDIEKSITEPKLNKPILNKPIIDKMLSLKKNLVKLKKLLQQ